MAYKTSRKAKNYKKYYRKRSGAKAKNLVSVRSGQLPLPNKIITRHRFCQSLTTDSAANAPSTYQLILNGLYSPMVSGTTHQPMGFDEFSSLYQFYKVLGAKVHATFINDSNTLDTGNAYVGLQLHENSGYTPTSIEQIVERGRCVYKPLGIANGGHDVVKCSMNFSLKKWYGKQSVDQSFSGTPSANPSELVYCAIFNTADYTGNDGPQVDILVTVDYIVEWYSPLQMNQSL